MGSSDVGAGLHRGCVAMGRPDVGTPPTVKLSTDANFAAYGRDCIDALLGVLQSKSVPLVLLDVSTTRLLGRTISTRKGLPSKDPSVCVRSRILQDCPARTSTSSTSGTDLH